MSEQLCPMGGDISNECADCVYSVDYYFNGDTGGCEERPEDPEDENSYEQWSKRHA